MRGPVGSDVKLTVVREGSEDPLEITITRDVIKLTAAKVRREDDIVVMRVTTFNEQTTPNLKDGIDKIKEEMGDTPPKGFVLDLRNNPGGLLSVAISVTDMFLEKGEIVSTRNRAGKGDRYKAKKGDIASKKPLVVLINSGSASASEIVAGALQDHKRAVIVGTKSFGKGSVQTVLPMGQDTGIRLTTARYYTPSGNSIHFQNLLRLFSITSNIKWQIAADNLKNIYESAFKNSPSNIIQALLSINETLDETIKIIIVGDDHVIIPQCLKWLKARNINTIICINKDNRELWRRISPFTKEMNHEKDQISIYVCKSFKCNEPVHDLESMKNLLI